MKPKMILPFLVLSGVPFIMVLGNSMLIPVFPQMKEAMQLTQFQVGLMVTLFSVPAGLLIPFAGVLSDHVGRKPVMAPALIVYGLGGLLAGLAAVTLSKPYAMILAARVVQGIGAGGTYQLAMALTSDIFTSDERTKALGYLEAANGLGKVLSPVLGSAIGLISWYAPFFSYGLLALPIACLVWFLVDEPDDKKPQQQPLSQYVESLRRIFGEKASTLLAAYAAGAIGLFLLFGLLAFLSDQLEGRFHVFGFAKGGVLAIPVGAMCLASFGGGLFLQSRQVWLKPAVITGLITIAVGLALLPLGDTSVFLFVALASISAFGVGIILPPLNTLITSTTGPEERGLITCIYGTVRFFGVAAGPPAFGLAEKMNVTTMFWVAAAIAAVGAVVASLWIDAAKMKKRSPA
ncbi:MAG: MFS transporter [Limnochordia bacterium]|jgi:ACDE family multidrug resistance protein